MVYVPTGRLPKRNSPCPFEVVFVFTPVATFTAEIAAFGTVAPDLSNTVPTTSPLIACAATEPAIIVTLTNTIARPKETRNHRCLVVTRPSKVRKYITPQKFLIDLLRFRNTRTDGLM